MSRVEFDFRVAADHPSLPGHFPGNPVVPGVLLLDRVMHGLQQATGLRLSHLKQVKFISALLPEEQAQAICEIDGSPCFVPCHRTAATGSPWLSRKAWAAWPRRSPPA